MARNKISRRKFLQAAGAAGALSFAGPNFSWAADGKVLKVRVRNEFYSFDPLVYIDSRACLGLRGADTHAPSRRHWFSASQTVSSSRSATLSAAAT